MPYRKSRFAAEEHYHVFNRGNNRQDVILEGDNYLLFLRLIRKYLVGSGVVALLAYCLMPNHYHLLLRLNIHDLAGAMQPMLLSYTKSLNNRYGRTGSLFQGRFKAVLVEREAHWRYLTAYIHRNPVEAGLARSAQAWPYSSYREYLGLRQGTLVQPHLAWEGTPNEYRQFVEGFGAAGQGQIEHLVME